jgi:cyclomaltodextrinase / maltogenic alpha-amylase / neopullulanase
VRDRVETAARQYFAPEGVTVPDAVPGDPAQPTEFAFHVDTLTAPDWARRAVIYHIFVDRFYPGDGRDWTGETDLDGFFGGTLWGVRDKLDYIRDLGVDCIWLSPIFASPTAHGYDTTDYRAVEPRLGGEAALRAVVEGAHERGLRVLLDMACNHLSDRHPIFVQALADPSSPYRDWFFFGQAPLGYRGYFDVATMPEVNLNHPPAREWMIENGLYWLREFAIDGYRLDYASGPGPGFWADFGAAIKRQNPEALLFGEIVDAPDRLLRYEGALDGCLDFAVCDSLRRTYGWRTWTPAQQAAFLDAHNRFFPPETIRPTFLDNHDMDRFLYIAGGDKDALRAAARAQMAIAAPAIVYYGTEVGLSQAVSTREIGLKACREPMPWGEAQDADLLAFYRDLIRARRGAG